MENNHTMNENQNIIKVRKEFIWQYANLYLENLKGTGVMNDDKFKSLYQDLYNYVSDKCAVEVEGDILDFYIVVEKYAPNKG